VFLEIVNDPYYEDKKLVIGGLEAGAIELVGRSYQNTRRYLLGGYNN